MPESSVEDLRTLERILERLTPEKRAALEKLPQVADKLKKKWLPNPGPQEDAYHTKADETFFGGSAGGGKSDLLMGLALNEHKNSLLLRRTNKEASKFIKRFEEIVGNRDGWNGQTSTFRLPGQVIEFGGCEHEDDKQKYKGDPHDLIGFDEIADFSEGQYRFITGWNRSANKGQRCRVVCAGNPPTTPEGLWVFKYWGAWLDPTHPKPAKSGELRWYTTINGEDTEVNGPGPHKIPGEESPIMARSRTFIRSKLVDNPDLEDSNYASVLAAMPEELRVAYRDGRFDAAFQDDDFQVIPTAWIVEAQERWHPDGWRGLSMTAAGVDPSGGGSDSTVMAMRYGSWCAPLIEANGEETADGSAMAALVIRHRKDGCPILIDVGGGYSGALMERLADNNVDHTRFDSRAHSPYHAKGSGLTFHNRRAEAYWRLREVLDPDQEGGSDVCLPPDQELRADLAAARYERKVHSSKIYLEDKYKTKKRIGRSPDKGDAVVMAFFEGGRHAVRRFGNKRSRPKVILGYDKHKRRRYG